MEEFAILMRLDLLSEEAQPSPEQMQEYMKEYDRWIEEIVAKGQFKGGIGLSVEGKVLRSNSKIENGPYVSDKESLAGYIFVQAMDFAEAVSIAKKCPILQGEGNSVEVRMIMGRDDR
ncbi:transcription initiation protein [Leptospira langatensis]|uniref:Transcription initiation protein n=1 Tax=Leptospira langatensis TaxID=2484983 RepID=A0A5F1ZRG6_9LEPT|nr:YciI family protein [Leptospira langatensis]TGK05486.1 transcription initiation protein [Leptospira langatensis]TGL38622.1 transcription initiation protein [Leptospira langatensis]